MRPRPVIPLRDALGEVNIIIISPRGIHQKCHSSWRKALGARQCSAGAFSSAHCAIFLKFIWMTTSAVVSRPWSSSRGHAITPTRWQPTIKSPMRRSIFHHFRRNYNGIIKCRHRYHFWHYLCHCILSEWNQRLSRNESFNYNMRCEIMASIIMAQSARTHRLKWECLRNSSLLTRLRSLVLKSREFLYHLAIAPGVNKPDNTRKKTGEMIIYYKIISF